VCASVRDVHAHACVCMCAHPFHPGHYVCPSPCARARVQVCAVSCFVESSVECWSCDVHACYLVYACACACVCACLRVCLCLCLCLYLSCVCAFVRAGFFYMSARLVLTASTRRRAPSALSAQSMPCHAFLPCQVHVCALFNLAVLHVVLQRNRHTLCRVEAAWPRRGRVAARRPTHACALCPVSRPHLIMLWRNLLRVARDWVASHAAAAAEPHVTPAAVFRGPPFALAAAQSPVACLLLALPCGGCWAPLGPHEARGGP
jgi:hypothetical protein